ncbi:hypothetical protein MCC10118_1116 [Bifidobacterium longum subsp. longum]|uniref:Uncharacterized protein n=1 Tax=Bifidobacterium longum subsp. longum TaxID=1679 RepID=A0AB74HGN8_BIFLL|nr:hypothetical protein MCC10118_1116 [Bifidobacterium longum subsp. longum]
MVWKRARRPFAGGAGSRRRAPGFECHDSRPAFRGPQNMETDGIMRKEDGPIRHKEIFKESDGPVRKGKGWPAGSDLIGSGLPPRSGFHGAREGVPAACPRRESNPAPSQRRKQRRYRWGLGRVREGKDLGAPVGPCGGSWGTVRRTGPRSGSSDHSSEPSVSAGAFALRRRETAMRAAPPPSTTTAASAISAMPAPVWARVLR